VTATTRTGPRQSHLRLGHARFDMTPPDGIYHRLWGAARHDRATGVHRPLVADLIALGALGQERPRFLRLELDLCCLMQPWVDEIRAAVARAAGVGHDDAIVTFSHTHSAGWLFDPARHGLPGGAAAVDLPLRPKPDRAQLEAEVERRLAEVRAAESRRDGDAARDAGAMLERARRWLGRLDELPDGATLPLPFAVYRLGEALWVTCAAEPYSRIQVDLRARFPDWTILFSPLAGEVQVAYVLPRDRYGAGLYQEEPSILAPGCLERLTDAIAARITGLVGGGD
jgi:hypothetical protein